MNALGLINLLQSRGIKVTSSKTTLEFTIEEDINGTLEAVKKQVVEFCSQTGATAKCEGFFAHNGWKETFTITLPEEGIGEMAFWEYDQYPYLRWGVIKRKFESGSVSVNEYSAYQFVPWFILPLKEGKALGKRLTELENARHSEMEVVRSNYKKALEEALAVYGKRVK